MSDEVWTDEQRRRVADALAPLRCVERGADTWPVHFVACRLLRKLADEGVIQGFEVHVSQPAPGTFRIDVAEDDDRLRDLLLLTVHADGRKP